MELLYVLMTTNTPSGLAAATAPPDCKVVIIELLQFLF